VSDAPLGGVLTLVERFGTAVVLARNLERIASSDARAALHAAGVIGTAQPAASWPCEVRGCSREIRGNYDGARKPLVAVCFQSPPVCMPVELRFDEVAQQEVSAEALVMAACALLGATVDRAVLAKVRASRALGDFATPLAVATLADPSRDVFWAGRPRETDLGAWCARRERAARATLVLVPTAEHVPLEVAARFLPGELVCVRALADLLCVRDGRLALREEEEDSAEDTERADEAKVAPGQTGIAALLGATRWEEIRITVIDAHTVKIEANGKSVLRTFVELGFVDGRKREFVTPTTSWTLFVLFCKKGRLKPSEYATLEKKAYGVKKMIARMGAALRASFGLAEHPIHTYSKRSHLWETRFLVAQ
jgi:hypothetical protein